MNIMGTLSHRRSLTPPATSHIGLRALCIALLTALLAPLLGCRGPGLPAPEFAPIPVETTAERTPWSLAAALAPAAPHASATATNLLLEGDVLTITFQNWTNYNATQKIPMDGMLILDAVSPVRAAGLTLAALQERLTELYKPVVKDDTISVRVLAASASVYVAGAVLRPGKIPLERPLTVLEAIMEAGGYDPTRARLSKVSVMRLENGRQRTFKVDVSRCIEGKEAEPFYLKPSDIVHVPTKTFNL